MFSPSLFPFLLYSSLPPSPESIEIVRFDTGPHRPVFSSIRLLEQVTAGSDSYVPITMATLATPPGIQQKVASLVFEVDVELDAKDSHFVLKTRLGGKK